MGETLQALAEELKLPNGVIKYWFFEQRHNELRRTRFSKGHKSWRICCTHCTSRGTTRQKNCKESLSKWPWTARRVGSLEEAQTLFWVPEQRWHVTGFLTFRLPCWGRELLGFMSMEGTLIIKFAFIKTKKKKRQALSCYMSWISRKVLTGKTLACVHGRLGPWIFLSINFLVCDTWL
jgi:hypothetical protein